MASEFDISQAAAGIYAESLLQLATEAGQVDDVGQELADLRELWRRDASFAAMMSSVAIDEDARRESIKRIFANRLSKLTLNLLLVLNDKRRSMVLPGVCDVYRRKLDQLHGREAVHVASAVPLDDAQRARIAAETQRLTGRKASLVERVDPDLLGGLSVQIADRLYDFSLRRRLRELRVALHAAVERNLLKGVSRFVTEG